MREYPISCLLIWKTKEKIKHRKFVDNYKEGIKITDFYVPKNKNIKMLVLDGQQRLQSLFIALKGSYDGKEFYFNVLSDEEEEDIKFKFKFLKPEKAKLGHGWIKLKDVIYDSQTAYRIAAEIIEGVKEKRDEESMDELSDEDEELIYDNISKLTNRFGMEENVVFQELDSVDNPDVYTLNDIVEVFIRANSGGTPLSKSDLMFSLLTANWEEIEEDLTNFLEELNGTAFEFSRDFVLKTSLIIIGTGAKYDVMKFRKEENLAKMRDTWEDIKKSIKELKDFLTSYTYIREDKALPSYLALIPLIYYIYKYPSKWRACNKEVLKNWLTRALLTGAFSGSSDTLLDALIRTINENKDFDVNKINAEIVNRGRTINISTEALLNTYYGDKKLYLIFALWYQDINLQPAYEGNLPWIDHIFPQSKLKDVKILNEETGRHVMKYKVWDRDQLANLMLLSAEENRDQKRDKSPEEWLTGKDSSYFEIHLIPEDDDLWKIENYEAFLEQRKELIKEKFRRMGLLTDTST